MDRIIALADDTGPFAEGDWLLESVEAGGDID